MVWCTPGTYFSDFQVGLAFLRRLYTALAETINERMDQVADHKISCHTVAVPVSSVPLHSRSAKDSSFQFALLLPPEPTPLVDDSLADG